MKKPDKISVWFFPLFVSVFAGFFMFRYAKVKPNLHGHFSLVTLLALSLISSHVSLIQRNDLALIFIACIFIDHGASLFWIKNSMKPLKIQWFENSMVLEMYWFDIAKMPKTKQRSLRPNEYFSLGRKLLPFSTYLTLVFWVYTDFETSSKFRGLVFVQCTIFFFFRFFSFP